MTYGLGQLVTIEHYQMAWSQCYKKISLGCVDPMEAIDALFSKWILHAFEPIEFNLHSSLSIGSRNIN
jgi:hypothetical protein